VTITLSHEISSIGLLERENAAALNATLIEIARRAFSAFAEAMKQQGIRAKLFLGQNDGTLMSVDYALRYPIFTIASGPSNSCAAARFSPASRMRSWSMSAARRRTWACSRKDSPGVVGRGGDRGCSDELPHADLVSVGLGGGSRVRIQGNDVTVGPDSVGYRLEEESLVFGGRTLTATDVAVRRTRRPGRPGRCPV